MAQRLGGVAFWYRGGRQMALRGNFTVSPSTTQRTGVAGLDRPHGFIEEPRLPFMEGDVSLEPGTNVGNIDAVEDETITAELANGSVFVLRNAWRAAATEINAHDGLFRVRFEGLSAKEFQGS
jgi:hypothetical protein